MRQIIAMLEIDDERAIEKDLGTIEYLEQEISTLSKSGIELQNARILDDDDKHDEEAIEMANKIFYGDKMKDTRKVDLFQDLLNWVYDHTENLGVDEYVRALHNIGFTAEEIVDEINNFSEITLKEVQKIIGE